MRCDRAKESLAKPVQQWCLEHNLLLTMTAGDDHAANGRVETEVNQVKRRPWPKRSGGTRKALSPMMSWGWVVQAEDGAIQHTRLMGKQSLDPSPKLGGDGEERLLEEHPAAHDGGGLAPALRELRMGGFSINIVGLLKEAWRRRRTSSAATSGASRKR